MVSFPPLAPSSGWFAQFLKVFKRTGLFDEAIIDANGNIVSSKAFGRYVITDSRKQPLTLSVAVEGGGRQLRSLSKLDGIQLSEHGDWRRAHLGALEANLGKMPFYRHIEQSLKQIYQNPELLSLESFNTAIFRLIVSFLMGNLRHENLSQFSDNKILLERAQELQTQINPEVSVLQPLALFGREAIIGIMFLDV